MEVPDARHLKELESENSAKSDICKKCFSLRDVRPEHEDRVVLYGLHHDMSEPREIYSGIDARDRNASTTRHVSQ